jgi:aminopeptidase N
MKASRLLFFVTSIFLVQCSSLKKKDNDAAVAVDSATAENEPPFLQKDNFRTIVDYRASEPKPMDLMHMDLLLSFNMEKEEVYGRATLQMKAHFHPQDSVCLDARGFTLNSVEWKTKDTFRPLKYVYNDSIITLYFPESSTPQKPVSVVIDYSVKPGKAKGNIADAKKDEKGFFFIKKKDEFGKTIEQVWTQGETEGNRCWFPTIDHPNQKLTHNLSITLPKNWVSLSNGDLEFSEQTSATTKTDHWSMKQPHAPYLVMVAAGPWGIVHDEWKGKDVDYYVDSAYLPEAKNIFGKTPSMISFFSEKLGVPFPWPKYSQVVLQDFISGAMENTTAVTFGAFAQRNSRESVDDNSDFTIAHELFHHWFGDLVTCESWSHLPLNESFATFGELMWAEHTGGEPAIQQQLLEKKSSYFNEIDQKRVVPIRYYYQDPDDMFDSHSYARGGVVLNMLRRQAGEEAFYASLKHYLTTHAYKTAEIDDLRQSFEEVTGQDWNWFFKQWFKKEGHPILHVDYQTIQRKLKISVEQNERFGLYRLPLKIDIIHQGKVVDQKSILVDEGRDTFEFSVDYDSVLVNFDPGKEMLMTFGWHQSQQEWLQLFHASKGIIDRSIFIKQWMGKKELAENNLDTSDFYLPKLPEILQLLNEAEQSKSTTLYEKVVRKVFELVDPLEEIYPELTQFFRSTIQSSSVIDQRYWAVIALPIVDETSWPLLKEAFDRDSSLSVKKAAMQSMWDVDSAKTAPFLVEWAKDPELFPAYFSIYSTTLPENSSSIFQNQFLNPKNHKFRRVVLDEYLNYLERINNLLEWEEGMVWIGKQMRESTDANMKDLFLGKHAGIYGILANAFKYQVNSEVAGEWNLMIGRLQADVRDLQQNANLKEYEEIFPIILSKLEEIRFIPVSKTKKHK